jgi:hypothetical protein
LTVVRESKQNSQQIQKEGTYEMVSPAAYLAVAREKEASFICEPMFSLFCEREKEKRRLWNKPDILHYSERILLTSMILARMARKRMVRASLFFFSKLCPLMAPASFNLRPVRALKHRTQMN